MGVGATGGEGADVVDGVGGDATGAGTGSANEAVLSLAYMMENNNFLLHINNWCY